MNKNKYNLNESAKSDQYERACIPQIAEYISTTFNVDKSKIFTSGNKKISPLLSQSEMMKLRNLNNKNFKTRGIDPFSHKDPTNIQKLNYKNNNQDDVAIKFDNNIKKIVPKYDQYSWFIFHTGYSNLNSDILVAHKNNVDNLLQKWDIQNIEIKRYASSYLFQPQLITGINLSNGALKINKISHAYLDQFSENTSKLQQIIINAIQNDSNYDSAMEQISNVSTSNQWLEKFLNGRNSALFMKGIQIPNVEELVKTFYFDAYDMNRQVSIFQIGSGKNARLFKISNVKSTRHIDPLQLMNKANTFSSAFNTIILDVEVRKRTANSKINVYGKIRFSNRNANKKGSFDPNGTLP